MITRDPTLSEPNESEECAFVPRIKVKLLPSQFLGTEDDTVLRKCANCGETGSEKKRYDDVAYVKKLSIARENVKKTPSFIFSRLRLSLA
jgi:hypothetical protein